MKNFSQFHTRHRCAALKIHNKHNKTRKIYCLLSSTTFKQGSERERERKRQKGRQPQTLKI